MIDLLIMISINGKAVRVTTNAIKSGNTYLSYQLFKNTDLSIKQTEVIKK